jgi:hypothetical protein
MIRTALSYALLPVVLSCMIVAPRPVRAGLVNDIPSCYAANHISPFGRVYNKLVYVLLDQTVQLDPTLQQTVLENVLGLLVPGSKFVVAGFSAFSQGHYLNVLTTGIIEPPIPPSEVGNIVVDNLDSFQACLPDQERYAQRVALGAVEQALRSSTSSLDQSDIMLALKTVSRAVSQDPASDRVLILVSDGLENSSVTSFYRHRTLRDIDPAQEMTQSTANGLIGDFGDARVYVIGGAVMPSAQRGSRTERDGYRDPKSLRNLEAFWAQYFKASNARLEEFGEPDIVLPVTY